jgi:hypothetical protein
VSTYPKGYQRWVIATKARGDEPDANLVQFATRYRFAGQLNAIDLLNSSDETQETYLLALRIALAYSALEQLEEALSNKRVAVKSIAIATAFRSSSLKKFREFLVENSETNLRNRLITVIESAKNSDVRSVIEAVRHNMFHGRLNPTASGLRSKVARTFLASIDQHLFRHMDEMSASVFSGEAPG